MAQSRFEFTHRWATGLAELMSMFTEQLPDDLRDRAREILELLEDNNVDLETYLNGQGIEIVGFTALDYGGPPEGNNKWQLQFGTDVVDLAVSTRIDFPVEFVNGGITFPVFGDDPTNGATLFPKNISQTGFDAMVYVGAVLQVAGSYRINWQHIGW